MQPTISAPVGKKGINHPQDVRTVQTLLNGFVTAGRIGSLAPLQVNGDPKVTIPYIETFQKKVAGFSKPDGTVVAGHLTWTKLLETPDGVAELIEGFRMVHTAQERSVQWGMKTDLWQAGLSALIDHLQHVKLHRPEIVTFMDFRLSRLEQRLWTVNIRDHVLQLKTHVAHGDKSGGNRATNFGNSDYRTSLGAYITRSSFASRMGNVEQPQPAAMVIGLQDRINDRALQRGIAFHAATYVNPPRTVANSNGCFATSLSDNRLLIPLIANGTFAFAYAG